MYILVEDLEKETKVALVEGETLIDIIWEAKKDMSIINNIYLGIVQVILPSEFAFIDIGEKKAAFLQLNDPKEKGLYQGEKLQIKRGDSILVQVIKDASGKKGPHVTSEISITSTYGVIFLNHGAQEIGVSRKIEDMTERRRLERMGKKHLPAHISTIFRTDALGIAESAWLAEISNLVAEIDFLTEKAKFERAPVLMKGEKSSIIKSILELFKSDVTKIIVSNRQIKKLLEASFKEAPFVHVAIEVYDEALPIYEFFGLEYQLRKALGSRVDLPCGGFLIFESTEACQVIDINSGSFKGKGDHEEMAMIVNKEAAAEIAKQIRIRNLSGIIMIDFLSFAQKENENELRQYVEEQIKTDRVPIYLEPASLLGLSFLTRKKTRESLMEQLFKRCDRCGGLGSIRTLERD